jgi:hypothetical protein
LHLERRPVPARIGQSLGIISGTVDGDTPMGELSLELGASDSLYAIVDPSILISPQNRSFFSRPLVIVPKSRVTATDVTLPLRLLRRVNGEVRDSLIVPVTIQSPREFGLEFSRLPNPVVLGTKNDVSVKVQAKVANEIYDVTGARVSLRVTTGGSFQATSDEAGVATFHDVQLIGKPRMAAIITSIAGAEPLKENIEAIVGSPHSIRLRIGGANDFRVGRRFTASVKVVDTLGNPVTERVQLSVGGGGTYLVSNSDSNPVFELEPDSNGVATFVDMKYLGPPGPVQLIASSGSVVDSVTVAAKAGAPSALRIIQQPSTFLIADSLFEIAPIVRVEDVAGNPVLGAQVLVRLWSHRPTRGSCLAANPNLAKNPYECVAKQDTSLKSTDGIAAFFRAPTRRTSDSSGLARFDSLRVVGPDDEYRLEFRLLSAPATEAGVFTLPIRYNADWAYNRNFAVISAIKSIGGDVTPQNEFFDVRLRFRFFRNWDAVIQSDLSIVRRTDADTDSLHSNTKRLVDASALLNYIPLRFTDLLTNVPERNLFVGPQVRIFNTVPFFGFHIGELELAKSLLNGSMFTAAFLVPLQQMPVKVDEEVFRPAPTNVMLDAFIRSSGIDFLKYLNVRGSVLIPFQRGRRPISRIVLAVPVGNLIPF